MTETETPATGGVICVRAGTGHADWARWVGHVDRLKGRFVATGAHQAFILFDSPMVAAACAVTVQSEMAGRPVGEPDQVGIDFGAVQDSPAGLTGAAVTIAEQVSAAAPPGKTYLTRAAVDRVRGQLPVEFISVESAPRGADGEPMRIYRAAQRRLGLGKAIRTDASPARRRAGLVVGLVLFAVAVAGVAWEKSRTPDDPAGDDPLTELQGSPR